MGYTEEQIGNLIDDAATADSNLNEIQNNTSLMQFWNYIKKICGFVAFTFSKELDNHKTEVNNIIDATETGNIDWYQTMFLDFQFGDSLVLQNNIPSYAVLNDANKIIKRCAIKEDVNGVLQIKLVKESSGIYSPLTLTELGSATAYATRKKIAGTKLNIVSLPADVFHIDCDLGLSPLEFDDNGVNINTGLNTVEDVIKAYLKDFAFGSIFYNSKLTDRVMDIPGVEDFVINSTKLNTVPYFNSVESPAGWLTLDINFDITYVLL